MRLAARGASVRGTARVLRSEAREVSAIFLGMFFHLVSLEPREAVLKLFLLNERYVECLKQEFLGFFYSKVTLECPEEIPFWGVS